MAIKNFNCQKQKFFFISFLGCFYFGWLDMGSKKIKYVWLCYDASSLVLFFITEVGPRAPKDIRHHALGPQASIGVA